MPIFPAWGKSTLSTLSAGRLPAPRREARVAAVCGFAPQLRVCAQECHKTPRCANVRASPGAAQRIPAAAGENPPEREEPASHLASRRYPGVLPNAVCGRKPVPTSCERGKYEKRQTIQHPNSSTRSGNDTPESSTSPYEPERLCDRLLSWKTDCDSGRTERSPAAAKAIGNNLNQLTVLANMGKVQFANLDSAAQEFSKINTALRKLQEGGVAKSQSSTS